MLSNYELAKAIQSGTTDGTSRFDIDAHSAGHPKQAAFTKSRAKFKTADCSRRAGKTEGCSGILIDAAQEKATSTALYLTKTRLNAKRIIWRPLKRALARQGVAHTPNESDLAIFFPNGSNIYLAGADQKDEIEKHRGNGFSTVVIDEAQLLPGYLEELVDDVIAPALMDFDGSLVLAGTPAPVPSGYFYDCTQNPEWEHHSWTVFDNPWIAKKSGKTPRQHLDAELKRRGVKEDEPSIQREWFARWVYDPNSLVFRYDTGRNHYDSLPEVAGGEWECVIGGDLGFDDADALCVLKWNTTSPSLWLVQEDVLPKQTITQLGDKLAKLVADYSPMRVVLDTGGLGKKIAEELTQRWGLKVEAAEKERKLEHIELLNDALRTGRFFARRDSRFAQDCMLVEWDKTNPERPKPSDRYHSDICDAVLYAYRCARQWLSVPEPEPRPRPGSPAWHVEHQRQAAEEAARMMEQDLERALTEKLEREEWEAYE